MELSVFKKIDWTGGRTRVCFESREQNLGCPPGRSCHLPQILRSWRLLGLFRGRSEGGGKAVGPGWGSLLPPPSEGETEEPRLAVGLGVNPTRAQLPDGRGRGERPGGISWLLPGQDSCTRRDHVVPEAAPGWVPAQGSSLPCKESERTATTSIKEFCKDRVFPRILPCDALVNY